MLRGEDLDPNLVIDLQDRRSDLDAGMAGLDALEDLAGPAQGRLRRTWGLTWPKLVAVALALLAWQAVVWAHLKPDYLLPGPQAVFSNLGHMATTGVFWHSIATTMRRALEGYAIAAVIGVTIGSLVSRIRVLRLGVGSLLTGLQTMPSVVWFLPALLLFKESEAAILFVVVLGAAPSIANGLISGVDHVPPLLLRAGRVLGARGLTMYRLVILPAALPSFIGGLKQGWAFAWRSLLAGELLVSVAHRVSIGQQLEFAQSNVDAATVFALVIAILVIGIVADFGFTRADLGVRRRWGLVQ